MISCSCALFVGNKRINRLMQWRTYETSGMVLVRNKEWPPQLTELKRGFGSKGAHTMQEAQSRLCVSSLAE